MWWSPAISLKISIIIPVYNEEAIIVSQLKLLQSIKNNKIEIILVDGGSDDQTRELASPYVDNLLISEKGRAHQMNYGANHANGELFIFLHIDTMLAEDGLCYLMSMPTKINYWGRFDVSFTNTYIIFSIIAFMMNLRSRVSRIATGDQAIFISAGLFNHVGGFPEIALMEDVSMSKKLRKIINPLCLKQNVITSSRRWEEKGVVKTILYMWFLRLAYFFRKQPDRLNQLYEK